jgi:hypothetical protein
MSEFIREDQEIIEKIFIRVYFTSLIVIYLIAVSPEKLFVNQNPKMSLM